MTVQRPRSAGSGQPVAVPGQDLPGTRVEVHRRLPVVGAVANLLPQGLSGLAAVSVGDVDGCGVQPWAFFVGRGQAGDVDGGPGGGGVDGRQGAGGQQVGDVDDGQAEVVVDPVAVEQPGAAVVAQLGERRPGDQP